MYLNTHYILCYSNSQMQITLNVNIFFTLISTSYVIISATISLGEDLTFMIVLHSNKRKCLLCRSQYKKLDLTFDPQAGHQGPRPYGSIIGISNFKII